MARESKRKRKRRSGGQDYDPNAKTNVGGFIRTFGIFAAAIIVLVVALSFTTSGLGLAYGKLMDYFFDEGAQNQKITDVAYLDIEIAGEQKGRVVIGLFGDVVPKTVKNFKQLCSGERGYGYTGTRFYRVMKNKMLAAGDVTMGDGTGGKSIYGPTFKDENFILKHEKFMVSMDHDGSVDSNSSKFMILMSGSEKRTILDGVHVVFGKILAGHKTLTLVEAEEVTEKMYRPKREVVISECGIIEDSGI